MTGTNGKVNNAGFPLTETKGFTILTSERNPFPECAGDRLG